MTAALDDKVERVRTVGDLTARHVGRQVQIGGWFEGALRELSASDQPDEVDLTVLGDGEIRYGCIPLDTPCELLTPTERTDPNELQRPLA